MPWKTVRLELASCREFPRGSVGRSYLIRLPLTADGAIDDSLLDADPDGATARRFWASEPDAAGYFRLDRAGYAIMEDNGNSGCTRPIQFLDGVIHQGDLVLMIEPDGSQLSLRVASVG